jgi:hypothetical protein
MTTDDFITDAINRGQTEGIESLDAIQRIVFLISEAEVDCDMNGIDTFLNRYSPKWIPETAAAFEAIGATEIAMEMQNAHLDNFCTSDVKLNRLNEMITARIGYDYEAIRRPIEERRQSKGKAG